ncbi:MAG: hypothetical protein HZB15_02565, partial [Actinobacteria bacterium]|nr:hypothetical protein [Actinomycetota bacterium]
VEGRRHGYANIYDTSDLQGHLVVGDTGLSLEAAGARRSVMWDDVAAVMKWRDGSRMVIDARGEAIVVEPTRLDAGVEAITEIDQRTRPDLGVQVGARYAPPAQPAAPGHILKLLRRGRAAAAVLLALLVPAGVALAVLAGSPLAYVGWGIAAIGLVAAPWFAVRTTRCPHPMVWDNGNQRTGVPAHVDQSAWYLPGGFLLGWAAARQHLAPAWTASFPEDVAALVANQITGPELYRRLGGVLADDLLDDEANEFFCDYLSQGRRGYNRDLARATRTTKYFEIPDTWISQAAVIRVVEDAFRRWQRQGRWTVLRGLRRAYRLGRSRWRGPQADAWGQQVVQRRRRRRWKP